VFCAGKVGFLEDRFVSGIFVHFCRSSAGPGKLEMAAPVPTGDPFLKTGVLLARWGPAELRPYFCTLSRDGIFCCSDSVTFAIIKFEKLDQFSTLRLVRGFAGFCLGTSNGKIQAIGLNHEDTYSWVTLLKQYLDLLKQKTSQPGRTHITDRLNRKYILFL
jgi:hypothetical protein